MKKSAIRRLQLIKDILSENTLELPYSLTMKYCFPDISLNLWCSLQGFSYYINDKPIKEFNCGKTIVFSANSEHKALDTNVLDEEL